MVKLRLRRTGKIHAPSYQIVAIDSRRARNAIYLEKLGHYFPLESRWDVDSEKTLKWLRVGAQPTKIVHYILKKEKIWMQFQSEKAPRKKVSSKEKTAKSTASKPVKNKTTKKTVAKAATTKKSVAKPKSTKKSVSKGKK